MAGIVIYNRTFTFPAGGSATQTDPFPLIDLSRASHLRFLFRLTKADTFLDDTMDIRFQERSDGTAADWDTRLRTPTYNGTMSPSAAAPTDYYMALPCKQAMTAAELSYEPTGSAGATEIAANSVRGGPLLGKYRPTNGLEARHRMKLDVTDDAADGGAAFTMQIVVTAYSAFP
jgi:hypothetical protein